MQQQSGKENILKIFVYKKDFYKEPKEIQRAINKAITELYERITAYEQQGIDFNHIFNDDKVKYDKHGNFYTFKCKKANVQLRILYAYFLHEGEPTFLIADYFIKKQNNKIYIKLFDSANNNDPNTLLGQLLGQKPQLQRI